MDRQKLKDAWRYPEQLIATIVGFIIAATGYAFGWPFVGTVAIAFLVGIAVTLVGIKLRER